MTERISELEVLAKESIAVREVYNRHLVAQLIMVSAELRSESRGGHYRKDFPDTLPPEAAYHTEIKENKITKVKYHE
ncbi:L-aspartate oxidase [Chlamydia trachomatis]|nr:L-aspartate oxidase [Chlamydia trachomatis]